MSNKLKFIFIVSCLMGFSSAAKAQSNLVDITGPAATTLHRLVQVLIQSDQELAEAKNLRCESSFNGMVQCFGSTAEGNSTDLLTGENASQLRAAISAAKKVYFAQNPHLDPSLASYETIARNVVCSLDHCQVKFGPSGGAL